MMSQPELKGVLGSAGALRQEARIPNPRTTTEPRNSAGLVIGEGCGIVRGSHGAARLLRARASFFLAVAALPLRGFASMCVF